MEIVHSSSTTGLVDVGVHNSSMAIVSGFGVITDCLPASSASNSTHQTQSKSHQICNNISSTPVDTILPDYLEGSKAQSKPALYLPKDPTDTAVHSSDTTYISVTVHTDIYDILLSKPSTISGAIIHNQDLVMVEDCNSDYDNEDSQGVKVNSNASNLHLFSHSAKSSPIVGLVETKGIATVEATSES